MEDDENQHGKERRRWAGFTDAEWCGGHREVELTREYQFLDGGFIFVEKRRSPTLFSFLKFLLI